MVLLVIEAIMSPSNNSSEQEKDSVNILSNNRGNNNTIIAHVPVISMSGAFVLTLLFVGAIAFFIIDHKGFVDFMVGMFKWLIILSGVTVGIKASFRAMSQLRIASQRCSYTGIAG